MNTIHHLQPRGRARLRLRHDVAIGATALVCLLLAQPLHAEDTLKPEDLVGSWEGHAFGPGANSPVTVDYWVEDGILHAVQAFGAIYIVRYTPWIEGPELISLYHTEAGSVRVTARIDDEGVVRGKWTMERFGSGTFQYRRVDTSKTPLLTDDQLSGKYEGHVSPGNGDYNPIDLTFELVAEGEKIQGLITFAGGELQIIEARRLHNRLILDLKGPTLQGIVLATVKADGSMALQWSIGVATGSGSLQKQPSEAKESKD